jgi:LysR family transcriptional activator of nhaA
MEWLNYHHLRYFWVTAREGSLAKAAEMLRVSQPSISEQIHELESFVGDKLFRREGRANKLTEAGATVFEYADAIFTLGAEMLSALKQKPGNKILRLNVGVVDSFPKLIANEILRPAFNMPYPVHAVFREGKTDDLLAQLSAHRLDVLLTDEPAPSSTNFPTFSHFLGDSGCTFFAEKSLAKRLRRKFPRSLHGANALLPTGNTSLRRSLELWFRENALEPCVVAEFEDLALMKVMAAEGRGFLALPTVATNEASVRYGFEAIGDAKSCKVSFYAVTVAKRMGHPAVTVITEAAKTIQR